MRHRVAALIEGTVSFSSFASAPAVRRVATMLHSAGRRSEIGETPVDAVLREVCVRQVLKSLGLTPT